MQKNYPMTTVPNLQGFPEAGYPVQAYMGLGSTLADTSVNTGSGNGSGLTQASSPYNFRLLGISVLMVIAAFALWHYVNVKGIV